MKHIARTILAGIRMQVRSIAVVPADFLLTTVLSPVFYTIVFLLLLQFSGRLETAAAFGIIAPAIIGMWATALNIAGEIIDNERSDGTLELLIIAPKPGIRFMIIGRILCVMLVSLLSVAESILVARIGFGIDFDIVQPAAFAGILALTALSTAAASLIMASTFVLSRSVRLFQNLLSFPFYLISGLAFPLDMLPEGLRPLSRIVALSWAGEGLRQSLTDTPVTALPFIAMSGLTLAYTALGSLLFTRIERRIRLNGSIGVA